MRLLPLAFSDIQFKHRFHKGFPIALIGVEVLRLLHNVVVAKFLTVSIPVRLSIAELHAYRATSSSRSEERLRLGFLLFVLSNSVPRTRSIMSRTSSIVPLANQPREATR